MGVTTDADSSNESSIDPEYPWRDEGVLRYLYDERECSGRKTAQILGCSYDTVYRWLDRHDVRRRQNGFPTGLDHHNSDPIDRETLVELHTERGLSTREIADELGRNQQTVRKYLNIHDVPPPSTDGDDFYGNGNPNW